MALTKSECDERSFRLGLFFKPTSPINKESLFAGRVSNVRDVLDAINQQGQHAVLYGEPGVGKTSLANMIFPRLHCPTMEKIAPLVNCMPDDFYSTLWKRVFETIKFHADRDSVVLSTKAEDLLKEYTGPLASAIAPDEVWHLLFELGQELLTVVILDEFDKLADSTTRAMMSSTLKLLSDRIVPATLVLIGVADDVSALVANHRSVQRCISQIHMPRMSLKELEEIVTNGLSNVEMTIDEESLQDVAYLSRGLPQYAHQIGLYAGRSALDDCRTTVTKDDVQIAMKSAVEKTQATVQADYSKATKSSRVDAQYVQVLLACALADCDTLGWFYPRNVRAPLRRILGKDCKVEAFARHLHSFCEPDRGPILKKDCDSARPRYRFVDPIVQPYIIMRGLAEKMIDENDVRRAAEEWPLF
jgi:Cdc6-like AAA superfamily ATPase